MFKLVESVLSANQRLLVEVDTLKTRLHDETNRNIAIQNKVEIKKLQQRIAKLENIEIHSKLLNGKTTNS